MLVNAKVFPSLGKINSCFVFIEKYTEFRHGCTLFVLPLNVIPLQ